MAREAQGAAHPITRDALDRLLAEPVGLRKGAYEGAHEGAHAAAEQG
ncbi:hypothetical protein [Streptomyces noursei]